ncbi:type II secretion system F family protein [Chitinibacter sp. GC72]|uniref:type II secretion system F family protein n=1 Tax=Chitinibacter sp. GC72 TaxID=1526917 RepID=UPI0018E0647D|nr:type II secretion system F family protein [Chitinibacter sp. GC72]
MKIQRPLPAQVRADLFNQLAALEHAGLPADRAIAVLALPAPWNQRVRAMQQALLRGHSLASAGKVAGLFDPLDQALIHAACAAGSPEPTYRQLARQATLKATLRQQVRARLALPTLLIFLALLIKPLPALIQGSLSIGDYLWGIASPAIYIIILMAILGWVTRLIAQGSVLASLILQLPVIGPFCLQLNQRDFLSSLSLLVNAGVPVFDALALAQNSISNGHLRQRNHVLLRKLRSGASLAGAIGHTGWLATPRIVALINTGEQSGTLDAMLARLVEQLDQDIEHSSKQWAAWLPRLAYALVAIWISWGLLSTTVFMPSADQAGMRQEFRRDQTGG